VTEPDVHLDLDSAAALDEGLDEDGSLAAHTATCDQCSRLVTQVRTTRALLSALPDDTMPTDVAERLHDALPGESAQTTIVPVGSRRRRWAHSPTIAGLAAAAAAIALVAAISVGSLRSSGHDTSGSGDNGAASAPQVPNFHFPVLASGALYDDSTARGLVDTLDGLVRTPTTLPATPRPQARADAAAKGSSLTLSAHAAVPTALQPLFDNRQELLTCARLLAGGPVTPLAIDFARFTGGQRHKAPAMVVLLPGAGDLRDSAFIVGPKCTTDPSQDLYAFIQVGQR
jgi:hypothetical protein